MAVATCNSNDVRWRRREGWPQGETHQRRIVRKIPILTRMEEELAQTEHAKL
jgi:hypothetical protein